MPPSPSVGDAFAVLLVGGTPGETHGIPSRPWPDPGQQVYFLETLGEVYSQAAATLGPERVVVIAGLQYTLDFLDEAAKLGHPPCREEDEEECKRRTRADTPEGREKRCREYAERAAGVRTRCAALLERGGADYDFGRVNPSTVMDVLAGRCSREGDKVVPTTGVRSVFFWTTTHGGHHVVSIGSQPKSEERLKKNPGGWPSEPVPIPQNGVKCDVCGEEHVIEEGEPADKYDHDHSSLTTREWFLQMPHRAERAEDYDCVTTRGYNMDAASPPGQHSPLTCLYSQQIFRCLADGQHDEAARSVVLLYQFCTSGGHFKWLEAKSYDRAFGVNKWPVFAMVTSGELQYSLGSTFTRIYLHCLDRALQPGAPEVTLDDLWQDAEKAYWEEHAIEARMNQQQPLGRRFGEPSMAKGALSGVGRLPVSHVFCNPRAPAGA